MLGIPEPKLWTRKQNIVILFKLLKYLGQFSLMSPPSKNSKSFSMKRVAPSMSYVEHVEKHFRAMLLHQGDNTWHCGAVQQELDV